MYNKSESGVLRRIKPVLQIVLGAFVLDLFLLFRLSYMGTSDASATEFLLAHFIPTILAVQAGILLKLIVVSLVLWIWVRQGLFLQGRRSVVALVAYWLMLVVYHARNWPAPYADIPEVRPLPDILFVSGIEGWLGIALLVFFAAVIIGALLVQLSTEVRYTRLPSWRMGMRVVSLAGAAWFFWSVGGDPYLPAWSRVPTARTDRPDVLILAADSWRADHFECRADSTLTPQLGALCASQGGVIGPVYTAQNRTMGGMTSLFTGMGPDQNGVSHMFVRSSHRDVSEQSLVRKFSDLGYRTVAVAGFAGDVFPRINLGFEEVYAPAFGFRAIIGDFSYRTHPLLYPFFATNNLGRLLAPDFESFMDLADPKLEAQKAFVAAAIPDERPLFMVLFLSGTHFPYAGRPGSDWRKGDDPLPARYRWWSSVPGEGGNIDTSLYPAIRNRYADKIQQVDETLAAIASQALHKGNTIVLVTSDHGEFLYEYGAGGHGDHVYGNESIEVPLVVLDSRRGMDAQYANQSVTDVVFENIDLMASLVSAVTSVTPLRLPSKTEAFTESGLIVSAANPPLLEGRRIQYPAVMKLLEVDMEMEDMVVQKDWEEIVEDGKFRSMVTPLWQFVYSPGCREPRMAMFDRSVTPGTHGTGHPDMSVDKEHPFAVSEAWEKMARRWPNRISRDCTKPDEVKPALPLPLGDEN